MTFAQWGQVCENAFANGWGRVRAVRLTAQDSLELANDSDVARLVLGSPFTGAIGTVVGFDVSALVNPVTRDMVPLSLADTSEAVVLLPSSVRKDGRPRKNARWIETVQPIGA